MFQQFYESYRNHGWVRITCGLGLFLCGLLFVVFGGGFPPVAWRFLAQVVITLPALWSIHGMHILMPFIGLVLQSLWFSMLWLAWTYACIKCVLLEWGMFQERREHEAIDVDAENSSETLAVSLHATSHLSPSEFDTLPDTVYPRMPSSARRYPVQQPSVSAQPVLAASSSRIPARASAQLVAVRAPVQTPEPHYQEHSVYPDIEIYGDDEEQSGDPGFGMEESEEHEGWGELESIAQGEIAREQAPLRLIVGIDSDAGLVRKKAVNEDNVLGLQDVHITEDGALSVGLFVVADGMGGHANGQEASRIATCSVSEVVTPLLLSSKSETARCEDLLRDGIQYANFSIYQHNQQKFKMGTTLTAALVFGSTAYVANVGDSRTYLYRASSGLTQITSDHSHVWQLYKNGLIAQEDIYTHPKRNEITRCLGEGVRVEVDTFKVPLQVNDVLLLCSDGLWEMVRDVDIEQIIKDNTPRASQTSAKLIEAALHNGGADNVSVVVVCITE